LNDTLPLFGASAHIAIQVARHWGLTVFVFTREGQKDHEALPRRLGADWVGVIGGEPPRKLRSAIDFTPVGEPVKEALKALEKGGRMVINAIRKINPIPELDHAKYVWHEREIQSVANVTRKDAIEFLPLAAEEGMRPEVQEFELRDANRAQGLLKQGKIRGAAVLRIPY
jgi:propanol-preferring alcohol dehydrogenase